MDTHNKPDSKHEAAKPVESDKQRKARIRSEIAAIDVEIANLGAKKATLRASLAD